MGGRELNLTMNLYFVVVKSFTEMTRYLLSLPGGEELFLLSERFSQDPLENHFGQQRGRCGRNDNPNVLQVSYH